MDKVVLLHGLARTAKAMKVIEKRLLREGYEVLNIDYPSREKPIEELSKGVFNSIPKSFLVSGQLHFVTHSMGGIIVRTLLKENRIENLGRVVMLSPPNHGSEVVDKLGGLFVFKWLNGTAGQQLGTDKDGYVNRLGPVDYEVGVITGNRSINWMLSALIPGKDDGKVSVESAKLEGMKEFKVMPVTHPFIMRNEKVICEVVEFLKEGSFQLCG